MYPHRIRLRGPWELHRQGEVDRVNMPARWIDLGWIDGPWNAKLTRRFGLPKTLDDYERVWITCSGFSDSVQWSLNGKSIGEFSEKSSYVEMEVTGQLFQRNELAVLIQSESADGGLYGEVALEIRGSYFLRDIQITKETLTGFVVGEPKAPLELYVLRSGRTVRYEHVSAAPDGQPFSFEVANLESEPAIGDFPLWRIELVEGANRWFTMDLAAPNG
jgi:hypothetical protein